MSVNVRLLCFIYKTFTGVDYMISNNNRGHKGSKCYTDGKVTILLFPGDKVPDGFHPGRKKTKWNPWAKGLKKDTSNKIAEKENKRMLSRNYCPLTDEHKDKISDSMKEKEPWNKGLTKETDERVKIASNKISSMMKLHHKNAIKNDPLFYEKQKTKLNSTMHRNNSFAKSKIEDDYYKQLCEKYGIENVVRQYSENRYPYKCDFYIPSEDLFIEFNWHWTHGKHPFDENNEEDIKTLELWKEKSCNSKFYKNAIYVWTELDPRKIETLKSGGMKFEIIYKDTIIK